MVSTKWPDPLPNYNLKLLLEQAQNKIWCIYLEVLVESTSPALELSLHSYPQTSPYYPPAYYQKIFEPKSLPDNACTSHSSSQGIGWSEVWRTSWVEWDHRLLGWPPADAHETGFQ